MLENRVITKPKNKRKKKKTKYTAEFELMYNGIERCTKCGFAMASGEDKMHSSYHSSYEKFAKAISKENGEDTIYSYKEFKEQEGVLAELKKYISTNDNSKITLETQYETYMELSFILEYNASIRFYDFNREHPSIADYKVLLMNTHFFINKLMPVIPHSYLESKVRGLLSNRRLRYVAELADEYLVYTRVEDTMVECIDGLSVIDLSQLDILVDYEEEDINDINDIEEEDIEQSLSWLSKLVVGN